MTGLTAADLLAVLAGAVAGCGLFLFLVALRGLPPRQPGARPGPVAAHGPRADRRPRRVAVVAGLVTLVATGWLVAGVGVALLVLSWRGLSGAASERRALARLEALATWTESLRDTIAGAVGLEQAIPASLRAAGPTLAEPLARLVDRLHTREPMPVALRQVRGRPGRPGG